MLPSSVQATAKITDRRMDGQIDRQSDRAIKVLLPESQYKCVLKRGRTAAVVFDIHCV